MNRDEIFRMALDAGFDEMITEDRVGWGEYPIPTKILEHFAALIAASEREACAKVCEDEIEKVKPVYSVTAENVLKAIRARGQA